MALVGSLWAQSTEAERTSIVYGRVLDAFDGLPLPGLVVLDMTPEYERARGTCNPSGSFSLRDKDGDAFYASPGEFALAFEDAGHWIGGLKRTLVVPDGRDVLIDIGPTFFLDCLLYTSPSPRDLSTSRMPSSA